MSIGLPNIDVVFLGKANTAVNRSSKGVACLIIKDTTAETRVATYKNFIEVKAAEYTAENLKAIEDVFISDVAKLIVIRMQDGETLSNVSKYITNDVNWVAYISEIATEQKALADLVKAYNKIRVRRLKAIVYKVGLCDDMHVVNFTNDTVTRIDGVTIAGHLYLGRLLGVLASCRLDQSVTYKELADLKEVAAIENETESISKGHFILINDEDGVRIARGVNSLQTNDKNRTEDMKYITIVEGMDLMHEDIVKTFKNTYIGKYKNSYDNQVLFISAVNSYFRALAADEVLDASYNNAVAVDVEKQREAWIANGKSEAEAWTEKEIKNMTFRTNVYLSASVKFLNAIEDLEFNVSM